MTSEEVLLRRKVAVETATIDHISAAIDRRQDEITKLRRKRRDASRALRVTVDGIIAEYRGEALAAILDGREEAISHAIGTLAFETTGAL